MTDCVVLIDGSRARFFQVANARGAAGARETKLDEVHDMINAGRRLRPSERMGDTRPGLSREFRGMPTHGMDDHRDDNQRELDRRFASDVIDALARLAREHAWNTALLVAPPGMLGLVRPEAERLRSAGLEIETLDRNLTGMAPRDALRVLAARELA